MQSRRLFFRALLKALVFLGLVVLLLVFFNSLFTTDKATNKQSKKFNKVILDISGLEPGQIKKIRWDGREVAVLRRIKAIKEKDTVRSDADHKTLNAWSRSLKPEYFVYMNVGDSGNCPLFYSQATFKDICTGTLFDESGREKRGDLLGYAIKVPAHRINNNSIIFGAWPE